MQTENQTVKALRSLSKIAISVALALTILPIHAMDLTQSFEAARSRDSTLASAEAAYRAAREVLPQAKAALGPSVQGNASLYQVNSQATGSPSESGQTTSGSIAATQPLYHPVDSLLVKQAEARMPALDAQYRKVQQALILRVAQAYFAALQAIDTLEATLSQKESLEAQRRQAVRGMQIGTGNVIEEAEANSRYDLIVATELQAQGALRVARRTLEQLTGQPVTGLARLGSVDLARMAKTDDADWMARADHGNVDVLSAEAQLTAERYNIDLANAAWKPTLDLAASISKTRSSQQSLDLSRTDGRSAAIGLSLTVPIWEPGLKNSKLRQAQALVDQYEQDLVTARQEAALSMQQALTNLSTNAAQAQALERAVQSSDVSLQASTRGREIGARTLVDVLNARQQVYLAKTQLTGARYAAVLALLQVKATAGELSEKDLAALTDSANNTPVTPAPAQ